MASIDINQFKAYKSFHLPMARKIYIWLILIIYKMYNQYIYKIKNLIEINGRQ